MINLNLEFDEMVLAKCADVFFDSTVNKKGHGEIFLTNKRFIIAKIGFFGKVKELISIPRESVKMFEGLPQVKINDGPSREDTSIDIYFTNGQYEISFDEDDRQIARDFITEVYRAYGEKEAFEKWSEDSKRFAISGAEKIAQTLKGTYETIIDTFNPPEMTSAPCKTCGGLVNGYKGKIAKCTFCGAQQKL